MKKMIISGIAIVLLTAVLLLLLFKAPHTLPANTFVIYAVCMLGLLGEAVGSNALVDFIKSKYFHKELLDHKKEAGG